MFRIALKSFVLAGASYALTMVPAHAQNVIEGTAPAARTQYIFNAGAPSKAKLGAWGNGTVGTARDFTYNNDPVLKVRSRNFYEGARFDLAEPIDLAPYKKDGFLRLRLRFKEVAAMGGGRGFGGPGGPGGPGFPGGGPGGPPPEGPPAVGQLEEGGDDGTLLNQLVTTQRNAQFGDLPAPRPPRRGGAGMPPLGGAPGMPAGPGGPGALGEPGAEPAPPPEQRTPITRLRIALLHEQGATVGSVPVDLRSMSMDDDGWRLLFFPLRDMRSTTDVVGPVRRVVLSTDKDDTFWLAQFALVIESPKMRISIRRPSDEVGAQIADITVKPGPLSLVADVESGIADPIIEWNFDADVVGNLPPGALNMPVVPVEAAPVEGEVAAPAAAPIGPRIDARGLQARFDYPNEEQNYRVEVTVRDRSGQKTPVKASILVRVRG